MGAGGGGMQGWRGSRGLPWGPGARTSCRHLYKQQQRCPAWGGEVQTPAMARPQHGKGEKEKGREAGGETCVGEGRKSQPASPRLAPMPHYGGEPQAALAEHGEGHKPMLPEWESSQIPSRGMRPGSRLGRPRSLTPP